jgi:hypothetical protein
MNTSPFDNQLSSRDISSPPESILSCLREHINRDMLA